MLNTNYHYYIQDFYLKDFFVPVYEFLCQAQFDPVLLLDRFRKDDATSKAPITLYRIASERSDFCTGLGC